ncbi:hypothetical protein BGX38DRAFT_819234 [Terfezia claveryi]|nr:hypothetical protein BGX38DRAFT_819234 [Terfezia claveryi]
MGGCLSKLRRPRERRPSSRSSSFYCAGVPEASLSNAPNDIDFEDSMRWTASPPKAIGPERLQNGGEKGLQSSPLARAVVLDSFQWATAPAPLVASQLHQESIGIATTSVMSESMTRTANNSDRPTFLPSEMAVSTTGGEFAEQDRALLSRPSCKWVGKRQLSLANIRADASVKRYGMVELSV